MAESGGTTATPQRLTGVLIAASLGWSIVSVGTQQVVPTAKAGAASGVTLALVIGLGGLGVAIAAALIEGLSASGTPEGDAIQEILLVLAASSAALGFILDRIDRRLSRHAPA